MSFDLSTYHPTARSGAARAITFSLAALLAVAGCATAPSSSTSAGDPSSLPSPMMSVTAPSPDPRVGLKAGWFDAGEASWNMRLISTTKPSEKFLAPFVDARLKNSDLAFTGNMVYQGNYSGWQSWDISNPARPVLRAAFVCPGSQSDVSVYRNLLFVSHEAGTGRVDCGLQGVRDTVSKERARGIRVYDISNPSTPREVALVQTCRGSHTHTVVEDPNDRENIYIYVSGSAGVRSPNELPGCSSGRMDENPNTAEFRLEVIRVPLANPSAAAIVTSPRVFNDLAAAPPSVAVDSVGMARAAAARARRDSMTAAAGSADASQGGRGGRGGGGGAPRAPTGPSQCHDITVYPAIGLAGGACGGYGLLLDIRDVANPRRIGAVADPNMSFWHSATFSNDGDKVLFSDEWGGGSAARCLASHSYKWGSNAIFTLRNNQMEFQEYFKLPAAQTSEENCVAHNGSLIPVPGRDIMVQSWYQGGISVFDWTDPKNPKEIAFFDRGPVSADSLVSGGHWSAYYYNGLIIGSEIARGLDILELQPSPYLSRNELEAAKTVRMEHFNPQMQPKFTWAPSFVVARAYLDQLARGNGMPRERALAVSSALAAAERASGAQRNTALSQLATQLESDAASATDAAKVRTLAGVVRELGGR